MAIPFYEHTEEPALHQQPEQSTISTGEEVDQVDGHVMSSPPNIVHMETPPNSPPLPQPITEDDVMVWKLLALTMCKALKEHYQQNMGTTSSTNASNTAVIQILPNGQVKPSWN